jgi:hypothetical protein
LSPRHPGLVLKFPPSRQNFYLSVPMIPSISFGGDA